MDNDAQWMEVALEEARQASQEGEVPVGAVVVLDGEIIAQAHNRRESLRDPTAHAEMIALRQAAAKLRNWRLNRVRVYVTLEPCPMCAGALVQARVATLIYGAADPKAGAVCSLYNILQDKRLNHQMEVISGVKAEESRKLLQDFFRERR